MRWLVWLLCLVTVGIAVQSSPEDPSWLPLPPLTPGQDSTAVGSSYSERLVQHWHSRSRSPPADDNSRLKSETHRLPETSLDNHSRLKSEKHRPLRSYGSHLDNHHRPLRFKTSLYTKSSTAPFHSRYVRTTTPTPSRTLTSSHNTTGKPSYSLVKTVKDTPRRNHNNTSNRKFHSRLKLSSHSPPRAPTELHKNKRQPSQHSLVNSTKNDHLHPVNGNDRSDEHYVHDVDLLALESTIQDRLPLKHPGALAMTRRGAEPVYKAWPGESEVESLDDLILYHTYTSEGDSKPSNFKLDSLTSTTTSTSKTDLSIENQPDSLEDIQESHELDGGLKPAVTTTAKSVQGEDTKLSLDSLILSHTQHKPGHHDNEPHIHYTPNKWEIYDKPHRPKPSVILIEDVKPPYDHHYQPPPPQTVFTLLTHRPQLGDHTTPTPEEASQIYIINNLYPATETTTTPRPYYPITKKPQSQTTSNPFPIPYPDDFTTKRPWPITHTTPRPAFVPTSTPHYNYPSPSTPHYHYPAHSNNPSTTPHYHYTNHRPPHVSVTTPSSHFDTHTPSNFPHDQHHTHHRPPHVSLTTPSSHFDTHTPSSFPHDQHHTNHRPSQVSVITPSSHFDTHRPTNFRPDQHHTNHRPPHISVTTPSSHHHTNRPASFPHDHHHTTHNPPYGPSLDHHHHVTSTASPPHYSTHKPGYISSTTVSNTHYVTQKPTTSYDHYITPKPPSNDPYTTPKPTQATAADKPHHVYVHCPNITITSTINNYNAYENVTKEGCSDVTIVINNDNVLVKDPTSTYAPDIHGEPFPPQGDEPVGEFPEDGEETTVAATPPIPQRPWQQWGLFGIKGPLLDIIEVLSLLWASLPTSVMVLIILVGTVKKLIFGTYLAIALWKHKHKKSQKKSDHEIYNTHLHLKGLMSGDDHHHKHKRKYKYRRKGVDPRGTQVMVVKHMNHRQDDEGVYANHREVDYVDTPEYENHRPDYAETEGMQYDNHKGYDEETLRDDYDDAIMGGRGGYEHDHVVEDYVEEPELEVGYDNHHRTHYDVLAGGREFRRRREMAEEIEEEREFLDELEWFVRGLIEAFETMRDEGEETHAQKKGDLGERT